MGYSDGQFGTDDPIIQTHLNIILDKYTDQPVTENIPGFTGGNIPVTRAQTAAVMWNLAQIQNEPALNKSSKVLIAYFSATNNTEGVANHLKSILDADLYEIVPETPYISADLNYNTDCRANREQNDASARPAISDSVSNMEQYDVIFLGYPDWWSTCPMAVFTFLDSYDFTGKTMIPFCALGTSGLAASVRDIRAALPGVTVLDAVGIQRSGMDTPLSTARATVETWLAGLEY